MYILWDKHITEGTLNNLQQPNIILNRPTRIPGKKYHTIEYLTEPF